MINFNDNKKAIKTKYKNNLKEINYYEKIYNKFKKYKNKKLSEFSITFKHNIYSNFITDNEIKIEAYANYNGYDLIDEKLFSNKTIYYFKKQ